MDRAGGGDGKEGLTFGDVNGVASEASALPD